MSNSSGDDYFSFMSARGAKRSPARSVVEATLPRSVMPTDIVDYVEEPTIEVTESFVSDSTIQRIFKQFESPDGQVSATPDLTG